VALAVPLLKERLTKAQIVGVGFAGAALVIFSLQ
jgi:EamA domain-containing membrane protein RarD